MGLRRNIKRGSRKRLGDNIDSKEAIRNEVKCCCCKSDLKDSKNLNAIMLNKKAKWENPTWGNVLVKNSGGRAMSIICDNCLNAYKDIIYAVEWEVNEDRELGENYYEYVKYHKVEELEDVPEITEKDIRESKGIQPMRPFGYGS